MTLSLALALNAIADVALLGGLGWFMSRPRKLTPHISARHPGHRLSVIHGEAQRAERQREQQIAA
jgi:hypothetical protein